MGWLEHDEQTQTVRRLSLAVYQAESFDRDRSVPVTNKKHQFAIQERLIDYTIVLLWNQKHHQTSMFSDAYHVDVTSLLLPHLSDCICYLHTDCRWLHRYICRLLQPKPQRSIKLSPHARKKPNSHPGAYISVRLPTLYIFILM